MAHALRYYKEITHADGKVIRIEFHEKNGTAPAMELGSVIQALNLEIQGGDDIDTPIIKTQLNFTLVDAPDHAEAKTKKCGAWEEFYSPDATHWKVLLFEVVGGEKMPIWGGYITPDSYREVLTYRSGVSFIARDNIGHLQDFPFDAEGNTEGMITLMGVLTSAWAKIESPMRLNFTSSGADWLRCEDTLALDTYMNVSAFEGKNWYEVINDVLFSYGLVMRFTGNAEVSVFPLRYLPFYGGETTTIVNLVFQTGAERELSPAARRIEETAEYETQSAIQPLVKTTDFSGEFFEADWSVYTAPVWVLNNKQEGKGWSNTDKTKAMYFNARSYAFHDIPSLPESELTTEEIYNAMWLLCDATSSRAEYSRYVNPVNLQLNLRIGQCIALWGNKESGYGIVASGAVIPYIKYAIAAKYNGITKYLNAKGEWVTEYIVLTESGNDVRSLDVNIPLSQYGGSVLLSVYIEQIASGYSGLEITYAQVQSFAFSSSAALCESNAVNTNFSETNNVILTRSPQIAPALNACALPAFIKNGIFRKVGDSYVAAYKWSWNGSGAQQMAVYNHLQLLCYYGKPNNVLSGTIVNGDVANFTKLYKWNNTEHIIISGVLNLISGYIENATLREFVRYEDMWGDLTDAADFPEVEGSSKTTAESGAQSAQAATYSNTTEVNIGGEGGGTIVLDTFMSDSSTNGVQNRVIKAYVDSSIANLINGAPTTLDTLKEIADAFEQSQDVVQALESAIGDKADKNDVFTKEQTYNREYIDGEFEDVENALAVRALKSEVYTKEDIDGKLTGITTDIDNLESSKADKTTVNAIDDRLKIEEDVTKTYSAWWAALMQYVKVENGNVVIDTNLLVEGESATRGVGDPSTGGGIDKNQLADYLEEYKYINEDALLEYGYATEQDVNDAIDALNIGDYAKTSEVERLFTALNIGQYAKTADVNTALGDKVDKVSGKGLSTNDFTTALLNKLNAIAEGAEVNVQSDWNATSGDAFIKNKPTLGALAAKDNVAWSEVQSKPTFADVATSGSYNDLSDKPTIPTTMAWTSITDKPTFALVATSGKYSDLLGAPALAKVAISGKYSDLSGTPDLSVYALTDDVERLFTALNISQYAKTSELGDLAFVDSLTYSDVGVTKDVITSLIGTTTYAPYNANGYLPLNGGTIGNGSSYLPLKVVGTSTRASIGFSKDGSAFGYLTYNGGSSWAVTNEYYNTEHTLLHSGNIGSYNAGSATKLQTARTIWGQSFDGTGNVSGALFDINNQEFIYSSGTWTRVGNGTAKAGLPTYIDGSTIYFRYGNSQSTGLILNSSGNVLIGTPTDNNSGARLQVDGNSYIRGKDPDVLSIERTATGGGAFIGYYPQVNSSSANYGAWRVGALADGSFRFNKYVNGTEENKFFITQSGNVLIGTSTDSGYKLNVSGRINATTGVRIGSASHTSGLYPESSIGGGTGDNNDLWLYTTKGLYIYGSSINLKNAVTMSSILSVNSVAEFTTYDIKIASNMFFNKGQEGIYVSGTGISWHNAEHAWKAGLVGFAADKITLGQPVTMSSTLTISGQTTINNNLIVTGDVAVA